MKLTDNDFLNAMEQTKLNQHDIIKILNQKDEILQALQENQYLKEELNQNQHTNCTFSDFETGEDE